MTTGLLLHLSGPMQSWGTSGAWDYRDTAPHPTRSGLIGLVAAAYGHPRPEPLDTFAPLRFTIRIDRPGIRETDFHTIGGGYPRNLTPPKAADGKPRTPSQGAGVIVTRRQYLADAAFTVIITAPTNPELINTIDDALHTPHWSPYLGRKAHPPADPWMLGTVDGTNPPATLRNFPLHRTQPRRANTVPIEFVADADTLTDNSGNNDLDGADAPHPRKGEHLERTPTNPVAFGPDQPTYTMHTACRWTEPLPASLCTGLGSNWVNALTTR